MRPLDLLYLPLALLTLPLWAGKKRHGFRERLGLRSQAIPPKGSRRRVLLHAVSVGEVAALRALVPLLACEADVVISVTTDTGIARARDLYSQSATIVRYPLDFSWGVKRLLKDVSPDVVGLVELEVWPQFVSMCAERGVPVCVINGRLSERSHRGYMRWKFLLGKYFRKLRCVCVQDETYAARFEALGCDQNRVLQSGSMKWESARIEDQVLGSEELASEMGIDRSRPLVVAGSTADDEEALLHACVPAGVQLLCAPRKPERFDEAARAMPGCVRRSERRSQTGDRFLLDTIGELRKAYALADVVVMGRSFGAFYGSDPIEPVAVGKATLIGPSHRDFESVVRALVGEGGLEVVTREGLAAAIARLLGEASARRAMAERGRACIRSQRGASERHAEVLLSLAGANVSAGRDELIIAGTGARAGVV